ncbi:MAG: hypothetical protein ACC645_06740 [Pirellulales bacterium]
MDRSNNLFSVLRVCAVAIALPIPLFGQEAGAPQQREADAAKTYRLAYDFRPGETVRWAVVHQATVRTTMQGTTQTARTRSESIKVWKVVRVSKDRTEIDLVHSVERVKMTNQLPNRAKVTYDSAKESRPPAGFETVANTIGVPLTEIRMTEYGKVLRRQEKRQQTPSRPDMPFAITLPEEPVAVGHVWSETYELSVPGRTGTPMKVKTRRRFKLESVKNSVATINVAYQVLTPINDPAVEAQLVQRLTKGTVKFDIDRGRILSQQLDVDKRVLGFSGPTSSIHHVMRRTERLLGNEEKVASKPSTQQ